MSCFLFEQITDRSSPGVFCAVSFSVSPVNRPCEIWRNVLSVRWFDGMKIVSFFREAGKGMVAVE